MQVFVYGTLMSGLNNSEYMKEAMFIGKGQTVDKYSLHVSGAIPFLHDDEKKYQVEGELYKVSDELLAVLDLIESNGEWYHRKNISVIVDNKTCTCQAYFNNEKAVPLEHGSFRRYVDKMTREFYSAK